MAEENDDRFVPYCLECCATKCQHVRGLISFSDRLVQGRVGILDLLDHKVFRCVTVRRTQGGGTIIERRELLMDLKYE